MTFKTSYSYIFFSLKSSNFYLEINVNVYFDVTIFKGNSYFQCTYEMFMNEMV